MDTHWLVTSLISVCILVIGYFLKSQIEENKAQRSDLNRLEIAVAVQENKIKNQEENHNGVKEMVDKIFKKLEGIEEKIYNKADR